MSKNTVLIRYIFFTVFVFHAQKFDIDEEETEDQSIKVHWSAKFECQTKCFKLEPRIFEQLKGFPFFLFPNINNIMCGVMYQQRMVHEN